MLTTIRPFVSPYRGARGVDVQGAGNFGASRGGRAHLGLDLLAIAGVDRGVAPFPAEVKQVGIAYKGAQLGSIHLHGLGAYAGFRIQILYVEPLRGLLEREVEAGEDLGVAQDVAAYYAAKGMPGMRNHVHGALWVCADPALYFPPGLAPIALTEPGRTA